ncbi:hypothetical protein MED01_004256 [Micromonospora sp. MED01]|uniref:hypothetical protein n=1 Tax=Micromonospora alfalfae TaxID=2911212 RepID=UPI001EE8E7E9|nr:hypothetical protein [Micromonospora alfalfae]MCG5460830.1 hypothetical protein [Micromonospora alfalfae]
MGDPVFEDVHAAYRRADRARQPKNLSEAEIRAAARRDFAREVRALLNFWEPVAREALPSEEDRGVYDSEVQAMVDMLERYEMKARKP